MSIQSFIEDNNIEMEATETGINPHMDENWAARHYECVFRMGTDELQIPYSMGIGIEREPEAKDVLDCLASDAASVESTENFEQWCNEVGLDSDSRKAEKTYKACVSTTKLLKAFLGHSLFVQLLNLERL